MTTPIAPSANNILDYIEKQLPPMVPNNIAGAGIQRQTLGVAGVQSACINGTIEKDEGVIVQGAGSYAFVPIEIIVV